MYSRGPAVTYGWSRPFGKFVLSSIGHRNIKSKQAAVMKRSTSRSFTGPAPDTLIGTPNSAPLVSVIVPLPILVWELMSGLNCTTSSPNPNTFTDPNHYPPRPPPVNTSPHL